MELDKSWMQNNW